MSGVYLFRTSINQYLCVTPDVTHVTGLLDTRETETHDLCTVSYWCHSRHGNRKATHTVTSHWYRSSRACGVGSGEWVGCSLYTYCGLYSELAELPHSTP